ncbi:hypothetical protein GN157_05625 [Flavobacterium rakeshii]|uniref:Uncharacterized protein n=1 Tax=Flavobacterium rakeshii TaxID=1038845 RepID=A0A6N8H9E8_9FLAO|nr:hypothetical protein [Flavobacterium rakeshii]MUV03184.1 hypothetical protein [Flavobacterium rakeshii]
MPAVKSNNPERAFINKHFVIRITDVATNTTRLVGAGKYSGVVGEKLKIKHFQKVSEGKAHSYMFLIRNRLKIKFHSK